MLLLNICKHGACVLSQNGMPGFRIVALGSTRVATLFATKGKPMQRPTPWPYKDIKYNILFQGFDRTTRRMNENSKVIVVEGSLATGKRELAKFIAKEFDMLHVPGVTMEDLFVCKDRWDGDCDIRQFDEQLPPSIQCYQIESFYRDPNPLAGRVGNLQVAMYKARFMKYCEALYHMFNTGQGIVLEKSPYSDYIYAEALKQCGYITPAGLEYYRMHRRNTICELIEPHLTIYLDTPVEKVKENIRKRGVPYEVDNPILSDEYLQAIEDGYKKQFLHIMRQTGHVMNCDAEDGMDWEIISEELERIDLDDPDEENNDRFDNWNTLAEDEWAHRRKYFGRKWQLEGHFNMPEPYDALELMDSIDDLVVWNRVVTNNPAMRPVHRDGPGFLNKLSYPKMVYQASSWK